jgi:hypothetical protein
MNLKLVKTPPSSQTELDIFPVWTYKIPAHGTVSGKASTFLIKPEFFSRAEKEFGDLKNFKSLEMGPNEGEIAFHLHHHGIKTVVSIEARPNNYLKCVVVKNILALDSVRFMCGDAVSHLVDNYYDICYCTGVFYHLSDIESFFMNLSKNVKRIVFQTHYYSPDAKVYDGNDKEAIDDSGKNGAPKVNWNFGEAETFQMKGETFHRIKHYYSSGEGHSLYGHGGIEDYAYMMPLEDIVKAFEVFNWEICGEVQNCPENIRGPWVSFLALNKSI